MRFTWWLISCQIIIFFTFTIFEALSLSKIYLTYSTSPQNKCSLTLSDRLILFPELQDSMATTVAVSPSEYLQPSTASSQVRNRNIFGCCVPLSCLLPICLCCFAPITFSSTYLKLTFKRNIWGTGYDITALILCFSLWNDKWVANVTFCWGSAVDTLLCVSHGRTPNLLRWLSWLPPAVKSVLLLPRLLSPLPQHSRSLGGSSPSSQPQLHQLPPKTWDSCQPRAMWFSSLQAWPPRPLGALLCLPSNKAPLAPTTRRQLTSSTRWCHRFRVLRLSRWCHRQDRSSSYQVPTMLSLPLPWQYRPPQLQSHHKRLWPSSPLQSRVSQITPLETFCSYPLGSHCPSVWQLERWEGLK